MVRDALSRLLGMARARWFLRDAQLGRRTLANGPVRVEARGTVVVGDYVTFVSGIVPCELVAHEGATLSIGERCTFNYGVSIVAWREVRIGSRCMFGSYVRIADEAEGATPGPIRIGDGVWVAHGAVIAAGVTLGDGAVVAAGSVVTQDVPPRMLAIGNPARVTSQGLTQSA